MLLKNHLIEVFKQASLENNFLLKENVVSKWVHRFGIDSLNDLLMHSSLQKENQEHISLIDEMHEENQEHISLIDEMHEENQEHISLIDEVYEENQEQIKLELSKTFENIEETKMESNSLETARSNEISSKNQNSNKINQFTETPKLPLPYIKNLRKWINNDKKAS
ncbi:MAG: glycoprotein [Prochlorococcus marinus XMU1422]|nr:glycoprotein [Prochlorococcus marinus XMU1422]